MAVASDAAATMAALLDRYLLESVLYELRRVPGRSEESVDVHDFSTADPPCGFPDSEHQIGSWDDDWGEGNPEVDFAGTTFVS